MKSKLRKDIIKEATSWIGTPFGHQGRAKFHAIDCVGLIYEIGKKFDILYDSDELIAKYKGYTRRPKNGLMRQACNDYLVRIPRHELEPGDILLMTFNKMVREESHIALYAGHTIIHAMVSEGKCTEHSFGVKWQNRCCGFYRYPGLV